MKSRWNAGVLAILVLAGVVTWATLKNGSTAVSLAASDARNDKDANTVTIRVQAVPTDAGSTLVQVNPTPAAAKPRSESGLNVLAEDRLATPHGSTAATGSDANSTYTAKPGDTVSNLAAELPGGDRKINRDAVINANPSLRRDPDLVIAGKSYQIPPNADSLAAATPVAPAANAADNAVVVGDVIPPEVVHELKYVAQAGDTLSTLAAAFLGSDTRENRDAIIAANASLKTDPDRLLVGQTYRIPVRESKPLAAAAVDTVAPRPTTQPDADALVQDGSVRSLRYVAKPGDSVSVLATALLGSDTAENREAIIKSNQSLQQNPDRVIAGKTYWIAAPDCCPALSDERAQSDKKSSPQMNADGHK